MDTIIFIACYLLHVSPAGLGPAHASEALHVSQTRVRLSAVYRPHTHREALGMLRHYSLRFAVHVAGLLGSSLHSKCAPENPGHWSPGHPLGLYPHAGAGRL